MKQASRSRAARCNRPRHAAWLALLFCSISLLAQRPSRAESAPPGIAAIQASPDGRFIAVANGQDELAVLDLEHSGTLPIYSRTLAGGFGWARDSRRLVFAERSARGTIGLWLLRPAVALGAEPLALGFDWKASPGWLDERRVAYLSDRDSDHAAIWTADVETSDVARLYDPGVEVTGLWVSPARGELVYRSRQSGSSELWWLWDPSEPPTRLTQDAPGQDTREGGVAFSRTGREMAYAAEGPGGAEVVFYDLNELIVVASISRPAVPDSIAVGPGDEVVLAEAGRLLRWRPRRGSRRALSDPFDWNGVPLALPAERAGRGWALLASGNLLLVADDLSRPGRGRIHARRSRDLIYLAAGWQRAGQSGEALDLLGELWDSRSLRDRDAVAAAATRAWVERKRGKPKRAGPWLDRALELAPPSGPAEASLWHEKLFIELFEKNDADEARRLLDVMPASAGEHPRAQWVRELLLIEDRKLRGGWQEAGRRLRAEQWKQAAAVIRDLVLGDSAFSLHRRAVALVLRGDLEPLGEEVTGQAADLTPLLGEFRFQETLLELSDSDLSAAVGKSELRQTLLSQWAAAGQREAARNLVLRDLSDPEGSSLDYSEMIARFLEAEEQERWAERAVSELLLAPPVVGMLDRHMSDTEAHLAFTLARAKGAIIEGDVTALGTILSQLERDVAIIPRGFWTRRNARLLLLIRLFRAKQAERLGLWEEARKRYAACNEVIARFERDWGIAAFDLAVAEAAIEAGHADTDLLRTLTQVIRGLGDPLVNPAHERATLGAAFTNLRTLRRHAPDPWAAPFLDYFEASSLALLGRPHWAIELLQRARSADPPPGLLARLLIEEAAVRGSLGQYGLASSLLGRLLELDLEPARAAAAIKILAQAEKEAGLIESQENRRRYLCRELRLPRSWAATLVPDNTILPYKDERTD